MKWNKEQWEQYLFTDVIDIQGGTQPPKEEWILTPKDGYIRMLQIRDFTQPEKNNIAFVEEKNNLKTCTSEDVLIGRYGASIGKILTGLSGAYNVAIVKTIPNLDLIEKTYLSHYLKAPYFQNKILNAGSRAAQAGFNRKELERFQIPLPPLQTQKEIADLLDTADALRQKTQAQLEALDKLAQSVFLEMFGDTKINSNNFQLHNLEDLCTHVIDCPHSTPKYVDYKSEYPCIRTTELKEGVIDWTKMKYLDFEGYTIRTKRLKPETGDIIYGREGSFGEAAIIPQKLTMALGQRVMLFRPKLEFISSIALWAILRSNGLYHQALRVTAGSTVGHLNIKDIRKFKIPLPPLPLQNQFATIIENIEAQKISLKSSLQESENLFGCLLQEVFG